MAQENYVAPFITASGAAFADLVSGGIAGIVAKLVTANAAFADPASQATVNVTGGGASGGLLPAGAYFVAYTYGDASGESKVGTSRSATFTVGATNIPTVTFNDTAPTGAVFRNVYLTLAGGASGSETLYITRVPVGTATVNLPYAGPTYAGTVIPATNTTGAAHIIGRINAGFAQKMDLSWVRLSDLVRTYVEGDAVDFQGHEMLLSHFDYLCAFYKQLMKEVMTLVAANPGSLHGTAAGSHVKTVRTFP